MEKQLKVAIQGQRLSFHEIAAKNYYENPIELIYCDTFQEVFDYLSEGTAQEAFVATRNSAHGVIAEVDELIRSHTPTLKGEYHLPIKQHLIGMAGASIEDITEVYSHPVALSQCSNFFETNRLISQRQYSDTAAAVEFIKNSNNTAIAAVGGEAAARYYGLEILQSEIQDDPNNTTTFHAYSLSDVLN